MARQLNPESKENIIKHAKKIMHQEGFSALSMRKVAQKSNMVVGNVYRYFKNKDDLINEIFSPVYNDIELLLNFDFEGIKETHPSTEDMKVFIKEYCLIVSKSIEELLVDNYYELQIIFNDRELSDKFTDKVRIFIENLLRNYLLIPDSLNEQQSALIKMFARSVISGLIEAINSYPKNKETIQISIYHYLLVFINLLDIEPPGME